MENPHISHEITNPLNFLKSDHHRILQALDEYLDEQNPRDKKKLAFWFFELLQQHMEIEERIFYSALAATGFEEGILIAMQSRQVHAEFEWAIRWLRQHSPKDRRYEYVLQKFAGKLRTQIEEEEVVVMEYAARYLGSRFVVLGEEMERYGRQMRAALRNGREPELHSSY